MNTGSSFVVAEWSNRTIYDKSNYLTLEIDNDYSKCSVTHVVYKGKLRKSVCLLETTKYDEALKVFEDARELLEKEEKRGENNL